MLLQPRSEDLIPVSLPDMGKMGEQIQQMIDDRKETLKAWRPSPAVTPEFIEHRTVEFTPSIPVSPEFITRRKTKFEPNKS